MISTVYIKQALLQSCVSVFFKSSPWKGFCLIPLNTKSFFAESIHFQWFKALCSSELAVVLLSKAFKAVVHEECFPLLYKFVHQHPGSDSLFFLTPPDRAGSSGLCTVNVTGQLLSQGPPTHVCPDFSGRPPLFTRICFTFFLLNNRSASWEETHPVRAPHTHSIRAEQSAEGHQLNINCPPLFFY